MAGSFAFQQSKTILARSGDVERASGEYLTDQREVAATGCICFFGQIRTLELRNSALLVQPRYSGGGYSYALTAGEFRRNCANLRNVEI